MWVKVSKIVKDGWNWTEWKTIRHLDRVSKDWSFAFLRKSSANGMKVSKYKWERGRSSRLSKMRGKSRLSLVWKRLDSLSPAVLIIHALIIIIWILEQSSFGQGRSRSWISRVQCLPISVMADKRWKEGVRYGWKCLWKKCFSGAFVRYNLQKNVPEVVRMQ